MQSSTEPKRRKRKEVGKEAGTEKGRYQGLNSVLGRG